MKRNAQLNDDIELLREEVNNFVRKYGLTNCDALLKLSEKLDHAIVRWVKENGFTSLR